MFYKVVRSVIVTVMVIKKKVNVTLKLVYVIVRIIQKVIIVNAAGQIILAIRKMESSVTISVNQGVFSRILMVKELVLFNHTLHLGVELQQENVFGL